MTMDILTISQETHKTLQFLKESGMKPDEKIAVLRSAASIIENVVWVEGMKTSLLNILKERV